MAGTLEVSCPVDDCDYRTSVLLGFGQHEHSPALIEQEQWLRLEHPNHPGTANFTTN